TREVELETLETLLKEEYDLEKDRLEKLIDTARQANDEAVDFFKFTSVLMRHLTREQCVGFIELLWEIVYADGVRHELEDHVTWRISELLGVSGRERVVMRQRVQERIGIADAAED
ncbi:MAG: TerB family tellurite resistance protein, partial [Pseudomonadota bacterium]